MRPGHEAEAAGTKQARAPRRRDPAKTREAIIDGLLAAVTAGDFAPTAREIAARAGTSERSVFVHFPDRDALLVAATERQSEMVEACLVVTPDPLPALAERITIAVGQSAAIFGLQRLPRLPGLQESRSIDAIDARMRCTDERIRAALGALFAPELARPDGAPDDGLLDLVDGTLGWPMRHHLQDRRGLSSERASATIERAVRSLLAQR